MHIVHLPWSNIFVALLAVAFAYIFLKVTGKLMKVLFGLLWLIMLPNTAYLFTDLGRILHQINDSSSLAIVLLVEFTTVALIGAATFVAAFSPFETVIHKTAVLREHGLISIIGLNLLVGFGVVLGRWEHINSYIIFTKPAHVIESMISILTNYYLLGLALLFGAICSVVYFLLRRMAQMFLGIVQPSK
jgi:uncharacterized membrane protein